MARYLDTADNVASTTVKKARDEALSRVIEIERNINIFIQAVEEVIFNVNEADQRSWMATWQGNLISGDITGPSLPPPPPPEEPPAITDSAFASIGFLSGFNGTDGQVTFTDESSLGQTVSAFNEAQVDTAQKKFGTGSLLLDGTGDYLTIPHHANQKAIDGADFTMEAFVRISAGSSTNRAIISNRKSAAPNLGYTMYINTSNKLSLVVIGAAGLAINISGSGAALLDDRWYHLVCVREDATKAWFLYVDGVEEDTAVELVAPGDSTIALHIGKQELAGLSEWRGWIDEARVTAGVARYTENFTPPTEAYPRA